MRPLKTTLYELTSAAGTGKDINHKFKKTENNE